MKRLAEEGARVFASDIDVEQGEKSAAQLRETGLDVTDEAQWQSIIADIRAAAGSLDILVNNAGVAFAATIADTTLEQFRWLHRINLLGTFLGVKHAVMAMRANTPAGGSIVNVSSVAGHIGLPMYTAYCASKGGVKNLTKAAALECGDAGDGIRINSVHPGVIWTPMNQVNFPDEKTAAGAVSTLSPLGKLGYPVDIANGVLFLASAESSYMTGAAVTIDGAMTAG